MIVIYTQDETYIKPTADAALSILNSIYGSKLGKEAYNTIRNAGWERSIVNTAGRGLRL